MQLTMIAVAHMLPSANYLHRRAHPQHPGCSHSRLLVWLQALVGPGGRDGTADGGIKAVAEGLARVDPAITLGVLWQMAVAFKVILYTAIIALAHRATHVLTADGCSACAKGAKWMHATRALISGVP